MNIKFAKITCIAKALMPIEMGPFFTSQAAISEAFIKFIIKTKLIVF